MSASEHAQRERLELADLLDALGPDAPTLCEGWTTRDLAAHLVVRESRPDALLGINGGPTAGWTEHVQNGEACNQYPEIVEKVRTGPPLLSFFSLPGAAALGNLAEYVVHHEDVIRAQPDWQPRTLPADLADALWGRISLPARRTFRKSNFEVTLRRTDGTAETFVAGGADQRVTVSGPALELLMLAYGRKAADVEVSGDDVSVQQFRELYL